MALKFLNKKGWHTGSLRNIENVWKAEQKHESEQKKLEELRKQIQDEREQSEFRQLQEQAGLVPKQERLEFLYDSGLAVGRSNSDNFPLGKPVEPQNNETENELSKLAAVPGALFVAEKPPSANDVWRKLHTDPLLMIRQREQEALAQIKNNPVKMEIIKKSVERQKVNKEDKRKRKAEKKKHDKEKRKREQASSDSDSDIDTDNKGKKKHHKEKKPRKSTSSDFENSPERELLKDSEKQPARRVFYALFLNCTSAYSNCWGRWTWWWWWFSTCICIPTYWKLGVILVRTVLPLNANTYSTCSSVLIPTVGPSVALGGNSPSSASDVTKP